MSWSGGYIWKIRLGWRLLGQQSTEGQEYGIPGCQTDCFCRHSTLSIHTHNNNPERTSGVPILNPK